MCVFLFKCSQFGKGVKVFVFFHGNSRIFHSQLDDEHMMTVKTHWKRAMQLDGCPALC